MSIEETDCSPSGGVRIFSEENTLQLKMEKCRQEFSIS